MKATTVFCLIAFTVACASAASIATQGKVQLSADAQDIVKAAQPLFNAKKIAKVIRIIAAQGTNSRAFIVSLNNITPAAQTCVMTQSQALEPKIKSKEIKPENVADAILAACSQYKDQLQPTFTAYKAAMPEMNSVQGTFYSDLPQSVQTLMKNYATLSQEIQTNQNLPKDPATFGPKVKALTDEFRAISEADRQAVVAKLPYMKELILPTGKYYADFNSILDFIDAKSAGQAYDETNLKQKGQQIVAYLGQNAEEYLNYINEKLDDYKVPAEIAQDGAVNSIAAKFGKTGANYAKMLFKQPQFKAALNSFVTGGMSADATAAVAAAPAPSS